jgi:hypothetical protein
LLKSLRLQIEHPVTDDNSDLPVPMGKRRRTAVVPDAEFTEVVPQPNPMFKTKEDIDNFIDNLDGFPKHLRQ